MDGEIIMINDGTEMIVSLTEQISLIAKETVEDFIIETIEPYCSEVAELKISKEELKKVILKNYGMPKPKHCDRNICIKNEYNGIGCDECEVVKSQEPCEEHQREFIEIVVEYPPADLCIYPEYKGKPYFSIKYRENGKEYVGFGTYKIEFLSQWIKEYFMPNIQPKTGHWEWVQYDYNPKLGDWHCSECRSIVIECVSKEEKGGIPLYKYCPQCGAKMESEE